MKVPYVDCSKCNGKCCKSVFLPLPDPDIDLLRWLDYHDGIEVMKLDGKIGIRIDSKCSMLQESTNKSFESVFKCMAYENRPYQCQEFDCTEERWLNYPY